MSTCSSWVLGLALMGCGASTPSRAPTRFEANETLPEWTRGQYACPPGSTCVIGTATNRATAAEALSAATLDGRQQLAEQALPTEVSGSYESERHNANQTVRSALQSRLAGRLPGVERLAQSTRRHVVASLKGATVQHDGWVLLAADANKLRGMADAEARRAQTEGRALEAQLTAAGSGPWSAGIASLRAVRERVDSLMPGPERAQIEASWARAVGVRMAQVQVRAERGRLDGQAWHVALRVKADSPVPDLAVAASGDCGQAEGQTDASGRVELKLRPTLGECRLELILGGVPGPVVVARSCLDLDWKVAHPLGPRVAPRLRNGSARWQRLDCADRAGADALQLVGELSGDTQLSRDRAALHLTCTARIQLRAGAASVARESVEETLIDRSPSAAGRRCVDRLVEAGLETVGAWVARLNPKGPKS